MLDAFSNSKRVDTDWGMRSFGHSQVMQAGQAMFGVDTGMQVRSNNIDVAVEVGFCVSSMK